MPAYQNRRDAFDNLMRKYKAYLVLHETICGTRKGACDFATYYLRMTYYSRYYFSDEILYWGY